MFVFFFVILLGIRFALTGNDVELFEQLGRDTETLWQPVLTSIAAGALGGVPFGYFVYQFYYYFYWRLYWTPSKIAPLDRGYAILRDVVVDYVDPATGDRVPAIPLEHYIGRTFALTGERSEVGWGPFAGLARPPQYSGREFSRACRDNWNIANFAWEKTLLENSLPDSLDAKGDNLMNVFHSLGASRAALVFAYLFYFSYEAYVMVSGGPSRQTCENFAFIPLNTLIAIVMAYVLSHARWDTLRSYIAFRHDIITFCHRRFGTTKGRTR